MLLKDADGKVSNKGPRGGFRNDANSPMRSLATLVFSNDAEIQKYKQK
ncbi:MAG: hypothetical protein WCL32_20830 [Planctomycetota bacterium]